MNSHRVHRPLRDALTACLDLKALRSYEAKKPLRERRRGARRQHAPTPTRTHPSLLLLLTLTPHFSLMVFTQPEVYVGRKKAPRWSSSAMYQLYVSASRNFPSSARRQPGKHNNNDSLQTANKDSTPLLTSIPKANTESLPMLLVVTARD